MERTTRQTSPDHSHFHLVSIHRIANRQPRPVGPDEPRYTQVAWEMSQSQSYPDSPYERRNLR